ncbi:beta-ketoacyl-[acyl-carrier-protein] synthase family protein [Paraclostridium bifermentans]|uniref:beta-ketoacyl-[acyl-carrier-protein] synthase family protein n=1 Tax=Paraclostridium TaxID=1849822 RepID=UPI001CC7F5C9|nr:MULTISPECIES: beta-ketoacyl-[acyl-carrier-protein] synthase family protein [Paraclostridium]MBZ6005322.1 beta-ketoacyl-[acyl-carrier-protein] synthase family protein [Paraclostridium bifermentans]MDU0296635.1 beta-ketoacyl-[acyl-carrier-protein] synthase family protein [Paraclostridium sp. MRS3W1]
MIENNKVVITGMGAVTSLGDDLQTTWDNILEGKSGIGYVTLFDTTNSGTKIGAQVQDTFEEQAKKVIKRRDRKKMTRVTRMAMVAANEAIIDSKIDFSKVDSLRVAVIMGVVTSAYNDKEREDSKQNIIVKSMPNAPSAWISIYNNIKGPNFSVSAACASSAYAITLGKKLIESELYDIVITGGTDSHINKECYEGFNQIMAMSTNNQEPEIACRPFSKDRDGFIMGEGAGILVLESEKHALERNAKIYAEVSGTSITSDADDITAPSQDGLGMFMSMDIAVKDSKVPLSRIGYVNAHGTSTYLNDKYETIAIKKLFGDRAKEILVSSTKSMIGHTIGASGVIEGIVTVKSLIEGVIPPTINYQNPDEELDLNYVPNNLIIREVEAAISNSFGFGGHNASIVFNKYNNK